MAEQSSDARQPKLSLSADEVAKIEQLNAEPSHPSAARQNLAKAKEALKRRRAAKAQKVVA